MEWADITPVKLLPADCGMDLLQKSKGKNRILTAAGIIGPRQEGAIRFSLCPFNTIEEMDQAAQVVAEQVSFLRKYRRR